MTERMRFAVIGCGRMGTRRMKTINESKHARLVCISDATKDLARKLANDFECDYSSDYREIANRSDVDCVVISLPNKFHRDVAILAMESGKNVICEKPLARTPKEAHEMVEAAKRGKVSLKVGSNLRYFPNVAKAKELLDKNVIGDVLFLRGWIGHPSSHKLGSWFLDSELAGGGTYLDNGCHILDLARWFMGEMVECVGYVGTLHLPVSPLEDVGMGIFWDEKHRPAFIQSSWVEWADYMYLEVYGREGFIRIDNRLPLCQLTIGKRDRSGEVLDYSTLPPQSYARELEDYIETMRKGGEPLPSGYDGMRVVRMVSGIYESVKSGKKTDIRDN